VAGRALAPGSAHLPHKEHATLSPGPAPRPQQLIKKPIHTIKSADSDVLLGKQPTLHDDAAAPPNSEAGLQVGALSDPLNLL
jgi:hypothetical protein